MTASPIPAGQSTATPFIGVKGAARLLDLVRDAFHGIEPNESIARTTRTGHAEVRIGDSVPTILEAAGHILLGGSRVTGALLRHHD